MQESFDIKSSSGSYNVFLGSHLDNRLPVTNTSRRILLIDERVAGYQPILADATIAVPALEEVKSLENMAPLITRLRELGATRGTWLLAVGGGVIQDLATFIASVYMRGLPWCYFPTTLLSMVDSCIGGKSSINVTGYKNLVGNFYPPQQILIDINYTNSLDSSQVVSGLLEAVKICYARGQSEFDAYLEEAPTTSHMSCEQAFQVTRRSLLAKKWFIEIDEFDCNERLLLNFGHTFGHALESATGFCVPHGIAVGIGMILACEFSIGERLLNHTGQSRVEQLMSYVIGLLHDIRTSLQQLLREVTFDQWLNFFDGDKKHSPTDYQIIVPSTSGALTRLRLARDDLSRQRLSVAFQRALSRFGLCSAGYKAC